MTEERTWNSRSTAKLWPLKNAESVRLFFDITVFPNMYSSCFNRFSISSLTVMPFSL